MTSEIVLDKMISHQGPFSCGRGAFDPITMLFISRSLLSCHGIIDVQIYIQIYKVIIRAEITNQLVDHQVCG